MTKTDLTKNQIAYLVRISRDKAATSGDTGMRNRLISLGYLRLSKPDQWGTRDYELTGLGRLKARAFAA